MKTECKLAKPGAIARYQLFLQGLSELEFGFSEEEVVGRNQFQASAPALTHTKCTDGSNPAY